MVENAALIIVLLKMDINFLIEEVQEMVVAITETLIEIEVDITMTDETTVGMIDGIMDEVPREIWIEVIETMIDGITEGTMIEGMIDGMIGGRREEIMVDGMIDGMIGEGLGPEVMRGGGIGLEVLMIEDARDI